MTSRPTRNRLWRKRLTRAVLCLLLGAATTVGVAWAVAAWMPYRADGWRPVYVDAWPAPMPRGVDGMPRRTRAFESRGLSRTTTTVLERVGQWDERPYAVQDVTIAGWPRPALWCWRNDLLFEFELPNDWRQPEQPWWTRGLALPVDRRAASRRLPCRPIWPGFLLDTLFYAAPWWLILITPGVIRRFRRRRRGRCIHCGYDLAGLEGRGAGAACPECGEAIASNA